MIKPVIFFAAIISFIEEPARATVINIPGDYPAIQQGIDASVNGDTVLVADGRYYERISFVGKDIVLASRYMIDGDTLHIQNTIIDADTLVLGVADTGSVVRFVNGEYFESTITGFTITNGSGTIYDSELRSGGGILCYYSSPAIENNLIVDNAAKKWGGGVFCNYSNAVLRNNRITGNSVDGLYTGGGGVACVDASILIENNVIRENDCRGNRSQLGMAFGGGIYCDDSNPTVLNNVIGDNVADGFLGYGGGLALNDCSSFIAGNIIVGNMATSPGNGASAGGGISMDFGSAPTILNNVIFGNTAMQGGGLFGAGNTYPALINDILWADSAAAEGDEIYVNGSLSVTYSDIQGGWEGVGNIDLPPLFRDPSGGDFHLMSTACGDPSDSPCIDAGDPSILDNLLHCDWGLGTQRSDMGAFGGEETPTGIENDDYEHLPSGISLFRNYPNPFNNATVIRYTLHQPGTVTISIYDLLGRKVATIFESVQNGGEHRVIWDGAALPSGLYFARMEEGGRAETLKMILMK